MHEFELTQHQFDLTNHDFDLTPSEVDLTKYEFDLTECEFEVTWKWCSANLPRLKTVLDVMSGDLQRKQTRGCPGT